MSLLRSSSFFDQKSIHTNTEFKLFLLLSSDVNVGTVEDRLLKTCVVGKGENLLGHNAIIHPL